MALPKVEWTEADVHAVRAVITGSASAEQQRRSMTFILTEICRIYDSPFVGQGRDSESFVMIGRHQVGVLITSAQTSEVLEAARALELRKSNPAQPKRHR